jgi:type IV fimbrial biogenesis protein FimT
MDFRFLQHGFTLVEVMVTLAVAAILLTVGVPNFTQMIQNNRMTSAANDFLFQLNYARSEAIKRGRTVTVCRSTNGSTCNGTAWNGGVLIFADLDGDGAVDTGEDLLRAGSTVTGVTPTANGFTTNIQFTATGLTVGNATGYFKFCDSRGAAQARAVLVNTTGHPQVSRDSNADTIHEAPAGTNLTCP